MSFNLLTTCSSAQRVYSILYASQHTAYRIDYHLYKSETLISIHPICKNAFSGNSRVELSSFLHMIYLFPFLAMKFLQYKIILRIPICNNISCQAAKLVHNYGFVVACLFAIVVAVSKLQPCTVQLQHALKYQSGRKTHRIENEHKQNK